MWPIEFKFAFFVRISLLFFSKFSSRSLVEFIFESFFLTLVFAQKFTRQRLITKFSRKNVVKWLVFESALTFHLSFLHWITKWNIFIWDVEIAINCWVLRLHDDSKLERINDCALLNVWSLFDLQAALSDATIANGHRMIKCAKNKISLRKKWAILYLRVSI